MLGSRSAKTAPPQNRTLGALDSASIAAAFSGEWEGTYTGDEDGTWSCVIDETGEITGSILSPHGHFELVGKVTDEGDFSATAGDVETGAEFVGVMDPAGTVEGTWKNEFLNMAGEFSGQRLR